MDSLDNIMDRLDNIMDRLDNIMDSLHTFSVFSGIFCYGWFLLRAL